MYAMNACSIEPIIAMGFGRMMIALCKFVGIVRWKKSKLAWWKKSSFK
jgi:hypothetical protein